jgi:hypothetical protein
MTITSSLQNRVEEKYLTSKRNFNPAFGKRESNNFGNGDSNKRTGPLSSTTLPLSASSENLVNFIRGERERERREGERDQHTHTHTHSASILSRICSWG